MLLIIDYLYSNFSNSDLACDGTNNRYHYCNCSDLDLTCDAVMKIFHGEVPFSKAKDLGMYLKIQLAILKDLTYQKEPKEMMVAVIDHWLKCGEDPSWTKLAEALEYCDHKVMADKIRREHGVEEASNTKSPTTTSEQI